MNITNVSKAMNNHDNCIVKALQLLNHLSMVKVFSGHRSSLLLLHIGMPNNLQKLGGFEFLKS